MAPQIRMLQNNNALLVERIQSTLVNTLPLWKNQMVLAIGLHHSQQAMKAQRAVTDATNELLKKNAETLKMGTLETAREAERGIIDLETLTKTNQDPRYSASRRKAATSAARPKSAWPKWKTS